MTAGLVAGALTLVWALVHTILGGRQVAGPLRRDGRLDAGMRSTAWMCWHMVTAVLFATSALYIFGSLSSRPDLLAAATVNASAIMVAGLVSAPALGVGYGLLPQGWLFVPVVACGLWAILE